MRVDKWLCTREGAAGIQGGTGGSPGASRGCGLGTAWGTAGAASGRRAEPHAPAATCSVGFRQVKEWEMHFFLVFLAVSRLPMGCVKADSGRTPGTAGDGLWVPPAPAPALALLSGCRAAVGLCRNGAAAASQNNPD